MKHWNNFINVSEFYTQCTGLLHELSGETGANKLELNVLDRHTVYR